MSRRRSALAIGLVLVLVPAAGCFGEEEGLPSNIEVNASQPLVSRGWAYDGEAVAESAGSARLLADNASGRGSFSANLTLDGTEYAFSADTFQAQPDAPWTANGINQSVTLHGDTGRATPDIPAMDMVVATWGRMQATRADEVLPDPLTGEPAFFGHVMVTEAGIRSDEDRGIQVQDGSVYAPSKAGNGRTFPGDAELHLEVTSARDATAPDDSATEDEGQLTPQEPSASVPFEVRQTTASVDATVTVSSPAASQLPPSQVNASLVGPSDTTLKAATLGGQGNTSVAWSLDGLPASGNFSIELQTDQGPVNWNATASVDYAEPFFLHAVYEEVTWQPAG